MSAVVLLEWNFTPPNYFEEAIEMLRHDYAMNIAEGKVVAKIESSVFDSNPSIRQVLHDSLNDRFLGVQLLTYQPYELSKSTIVRVHPDRCEEHLISLGQLDECPAGRGREPGDEHAHQPALARPLDHLLTIRIEFFKVQMTVCIG